MFHLSKTANGREAHWMSIAYLYSIQIRTAGPDIEEHIYINYQAAPRPVGRLAHMQLHERALLGYPNETARP